jgi:Lactonase, 7-bladed beta-propeller
MHKSGRFVYGSNRGHDSIAVFSVGTDGALTLVEYEPTRGQTPRNLSLDPSARTNRRISHPAMRVLLFLCDRRREDFLHGETATAPGQRIELVAAVGPERMRHPPYETNPA